MRHTLKEHATQHTGSNANQTSTGKTSRIVTCANTRWSDNSLQAPPTVRALQQRIGSAAVCKLVQRTPHVPEVDSLVLLATDLRMHLDPPGHATSSSLTRGSQPGGANTAVQYSYNALFTLTVNRPVKDTRLGADIAAAHIVADAAGWTTPTFDIKVQSPSWNQITINVLLGFRIELAKEFTYSYLQRAHWYLLLVKFSTLAKSIRNKLTS